LYVFHWVLQALRRARNGDKDADLTMREVSRLELNQHLTFHYGDPSVLPHDLDALGGSRAPARAMSPLASGCTRDALDSTGIASLSRQHGHSLQGSSDSLLFADTRLAQCPGPESESETSQTREYVDACVAMGVRVKMQVRTCRVRHEF
jgi:hypothetical protein